VADVASKLGLDFLDAGINVFGNALGEHFNGAVGQVAYKTGYLTVFCDTSGGVAKTNALDLAGKNDMSGGLFHFGLFMRY
jgi:hypothetical protein